METTNNSSRFVPPWDQLFSELTPFYTHLYASLEEAIRLSVKYFNDDVKLPIDSFFLNDHIRFHTKRLLSLKTGATIEEIYSPIDLANSGLAGVFNDYSIRVRKAYEGGPPTLNSVSMEEYCSQQLSFYLVDDGILRPVKRPNVVFVWDMTENHVLKPVYLCCPKQANNHRIVSFHYYERLPHPAEIIRVKPEIPTEIRDIAIEPKEKTEPENIESLKENSEDDNQNSDNKRGQDQTS